MDVLRVRLTSRFTQLRPPLRFCALSLVLPLNRSDGPPGILVMIKIENMSPLITQLRSRDVDVYVRPKTLR